MIHTKSEWQNMLLRPTKFRELAQALYELDGEISNIGESSGDTSSDINDIRQALSSIEDELSSMWVEINGLYNRISDLENA